MLKSRETDEDTKFLVEKAARGLVNTVDIQGSDAVMDWEVRPNVCVDTDMLAIALNIFHVLFSPDFNFVEKDRASTFRVNPYLLRSFLPFLVSSLVLWFY